MGLTALEFAITYGHRRLYPILLRAGASFDTRPILAYNRAYVYAGHTAMHQAARNLKNDPYLRKVTAAGGFKAYEKAHRHTLVAWAAKCFPRLPVEVAAQVVAFAFHTGYY